MAYDLYLLPVPAGADIEEAGEALVARIRFGHERPSPEHSLRGRRDEFAARLSIAAQDPATTASDDEGAALLCLGDGLEVRVADRYLRLRMPFTLSGEEAAAAFERLFHVAAVASEETGWVLYDPQEAAGVPLDEEGLRETREIYLSVMDQLGAADEA